jgi:hypothetical protein
MDFCSAKASMGTGFAGVLKVKAFLFFFTPLISQSGSVTINEFGRPIKDVRTQFHLTFRKCITGKCLHVSRLWSIIDSKFEPKKIRNDSRKAIYLAMAVMAAVSLGQ